MKITELKIAPSQSWQDPSASNPMVCVVKLKSDKATVETVLSEDQMHQVLMLVKQIVAEAAAKNVADFVAAVSQVEADSVRGLLA